MSSLLSKIKGVLVAAFQIDAANSGPLLKNVGGVLEVRNEADDSYAIARGADPIGANDLATKSFVEAGGAGDFGLPFYFIPSGSNITIPVNRQHLILGDMTTEGELIIEGELVIL